MDSESLIEQTDDLRARARAAYRGGDLASAESLYESARRLAHQHGNQPLEDLCACSRAGLAIEQERGDPEVPSLLALLVRNPAPFTGWLAAYWIARHYEIKKDYKKSLFYGHAALKRARVVNEREPLSGTLNLIGNVLLTQGYGTEATTYFQSALGEVAPDSVPAGLFRANLGYCQVLAGAPAEGVGNLLRGVRTLKRGGAKWYLAQAYLDLSHGFLEMGRSASARRHGQRAWELSSALGYATGQKNALYLLGQTARLGEDLAEARAHFARLQSSFYPSQPYLVDFLMTVDIGGMVNLHA